MSKTIFFYIYIYIYTFLSKVLEVVGWVSTNPLIPLHGSATNHNVEISLAAPQISYCVQREPLVARQYIQKEGDFLVFSAKCWDDRGQ